MSKFSTYLRKIFDESGEPIASVARSIGAERTSIHKALAGERQLPYKVVRALATHFQLSLEERREFFQLYQMGLQGEEVWQNRQAICDLINQLSAIQFVKNGDKSVKMPPDLSCPAFDAEPLEGEYNIRHAIHSVLEYELIKDKEPVFYLYLPEGFSLTDEFMDFWLDGFRFSVEQLFCFPITSNHNAAQNVRQLRDIIPLCLVSKGTYRPYYFCEPARSASLQPLGYYIVTEHFLIQLSRNFSTALVQASEKLIAYYSNYVQNLFEQCDLLTHCSSDIMELLGRYCMEMDEGGLLYVASQPCLGRYFTEPVIRKYMRPSPDIPYQIMFDAVQNRYSALGKIKKNYYTVFSEKGLRYFIDTGIITDLPAQYVLPVEPQDRVQMLSKLRDEMISGTVIGLMVRPSQLRLSDDIFMYMDVKGNVHFDTTDTFIHGAYSCDIHISEKDICDAFRDFFLSLQDSYVVYTKEDTLLILENGIRMLAEC